MFAYLNYVLRRVTHMKGLKNFLDEEQRLKVWPSRPANKRLACEYLAGKFEEGADYSEKEVNRIISEWHTFNDYFLLRRSLVEYGLLGRTSSGSCYWKEKQVADNDCRLTP